MSQYALDGTLVDTYTSIKEATENVKGTNSANISACCREKRKTHKGFIWKYT